MFAIYRTPILILVILLCVTAAAEAKTVSDSRYGYSLEIPDDFIGDSGMAGINRNVLYAFRRPGNGSRATQCIAIVKQTDPVDSHRAKQSEVPAGKDATLFSLPWKDVNVDCIRIGEKAGTDQVVTYKARMPLVGQQIQIVVLGKAEESEQLRGVLESIVPTVDGEIDPNDPAVIESRSGAGASQPMLITAILLAISASLLIGWVVRRHFRAKLNVPNPTLPATT